MKKPGRPRLTEAQRASLRIERRKRREPAAERLRIALERLVPSQAEAARRSGVTQGHIADMLRLERDITREDLRKFATTMRISADYLLGVADATVVINETRTLEFYAELAAATERELNLQCPPEIDDGSESYRWVTSGSALFRMVVATLVHEAKTLLGEERACRDLETATGKSRSEARTLLDIARGDGPGQSRYTRLGLIVHGVQLVSDGGDDLSASERGLVLADQQYAESRNEPGFPIRHMPKAVHVVTPELPKKTTTRRKKR